MLSWRATATFGDSKESLSVLSEYKPFNNYSYLLSSLVFSSDILSRVPFLHLSRSSVQLRST